MIECCGVGCDCTDFSEKYNNRECVFFRLIFRFAFQESWREPVYLSLSLGTMRSFITQAAQREIRLRPGQYSKFRKIIHLICYPNRIWLSFFALCAGKVFFYFFLFSIFIFFVLTLRRFNLMASLQFSSLSQHLLLLLLSLSLPLKYRTKFNLIFFFSPFPFSIYGLRLPAAVQQMANEQWMKGEKKKKITQFAKKRLALDN